MVYKITQCSFIFPFNLVMDNFPGGLASKESACNVGDLGLILGSGRFPGGGHANPLQYSGLENSMDNPAELQSMGSQRVGHD